jgi:phthiocerol/phenolphthiocerol synthesis type-I polyketide synthase E
MVGASEPIAVVGMACRLPGARNIDEFWHNLVDGTESITVFSEDALRAAGVPQSSISDPNYVRAAPLMPDVELFDADLFGLTAAEARLCGPQVRVFLELCHAALEHAGYDPFAITESVGVFGTTAANGYLREVAVRRPELLRGSAGVLSHILNDPAYLAALVAYKLDLRGPSMTVLAACSSSLVTAHVAAQALRAGECDVAVAGGAVVDLPVGHGYMCTPGGMYSADGHCRPFDKAAAGTVFGSGAGVVVLKRLEDALAAGDTVRAVIRGSAVNNDGATKMSFIAPSVAGQSAVVAEAMALAGVHPNEVDYVEAHATGTALGDPLEVAALSEAFRMLVDEPLPPASTAIGSVKSNIGHMDAVSGVAGLIKTVLMLDREAIVPTVNVDEVSPRLALGSTPFTVATQLRSWHRRPGRQRIASVSSLGVGGNAHMVLSEGPAPIAASRSQKRHPRVVTWSGRTDRAVDDLRHQLTSYFSALPEQDFADAVGTLQHGRTPHPVRAALVCDSAADAANALADPSRQIVGTAAGDVSPVFLFPGQTAHRAMMAAGLYGTVRSFSIAMDESIEVFEQRGVALLDNWLSARHENDITLVEPLLFAVEYALAAMWSEFGVEPKALLGHSLGELTAATVAGVFTLPDAATLVRARMRAMVEHPVEGGMLAVAAGVADVAELLPEGVVVAAVNSPRQTVLAGARAALEDAARAMSAAAIAARPLAVSHALHHPDWGAATDSIAAALAEVELRRPRTSLYSGVTGERISDAQAVDVSFWASQLAKPVRFSPALQALVADHDRLMIEVGPGRTLTRLTRAHNAMGARAHVVATLPDGADEPTAVLRAAAEFWVHGGRVDWDETGQPAPGRRLAVPGYPYQRERFWPDPPAHSALATPSPSGESTPVAATRPVAVAGSADSPFTVVEWTQQDRPSGGTAAARGALVLLPADPADALRVLLAVERAGYRAVRMRPDTQYGLHDGEYRIRPGQPDDLRRALADLHQRGIGLDTFVHACGVTTTPAATAATLSSDLELVFGSALALARLALEQPGPARFVVLTTGAVDVSGDDRLEPVKATALGLVRTLLAEALDMRCALIDIGDRVTVPDLADELCVREPPPVVALRGTRRWLPAERSLTLPAAGGTVLRGRGVYLVTGGFGRLGQEVARVLAANGERPTLILLGPDNPLADDHPDDSPTGSSHRTICDLQALGAQVHAVSADVTNLHSVRSAIADVTVHTGPINGVIHTASAPGEGMNDDHDESAVLVSMALGAVHIATVLGDDAALDFAVLFSSRAAIDGLAGAAGYAAGAAFVDALAASRISAAGRMTSIGWPVWPPTTTTDQGTRGIVPATGGVSHASAGEPAREEPVVWETEIGPKSHWMLDEHRVGNTPRLPEAGFLDLVVTAFTETLAERDAAVALTDVTFHEPLAETGARTLRVTFTPIGGPAFELAVTSRTPGGWVLHVDGKAAGIVQTAPEVDVGALRTRMRTAGEPHAAAVPEEQLFTVGPRWRNVVDVQQAFDEKLVSLALWPALAHDVAHHRLHPAMLDTATAAIRAPGEGSFVPSSYRRIVVYRNLPATFLSHVRRQPSGPDTAVGDIDLLTEDGTALATIEAFTMRRFDFREGRDRQPGGAAPARGPLKPALPTVPELDVETAMRLLVRLLATRSSPSVLIRPHLAGRPLPVSAPSPGPAADRAPQPGTPDRLRALWEEVLGCEPASDEEDFFEAGGESLAAIELVARVRATFGVDLSLESLMKVRTYGALHDVIADLAC